MIQRMRRAARGIARWSAALLLAASAVGVGAVGRPAWAQARPAPAGGAPRPGMEQLAELVKQRLGLTDAQALKLRASTRRFAVERQRIVQGERSARRELRAQIEAGEGADQQRVGVLLDTLLLLQRRRVEVLATEQRELATFLSPVQRAQFLALQERASRAAQQMRLRREASESGGRGAREPGARRGAWRADTSARPF